MTENQVTKVNDVKSTSVSITLNAKSLGVDAFIKLEQTCEFAIPISEVDALVKREEMAALLTEQTLAIVNDTTRQVSQFSKANNIAPTADTIRHAANNGGLEWRSAVDTFDSAKQVRYVSTASIPTDVLKQKASEWISQQGYNAEAFDVWDERKDAESGKPISSVCNIKVKEEYRNALPTDLIFTEKGGVKAVIRAKFNSDGSIYFHWTNKQVETAVKYGAFDSLKN